jgi:WD40 repeat protein
MKKFLNPELLGGLFLNLIFLFLSVIFLRNAFAEDYTRWGLPEGAKMRLGKGQIFDLAYSPDGTRLAVGSSIGIWLCNAQTGAEIALITGHTRLRLKTFSADGRTLIGRTPDDKIWLWDARTGKHKATLSVDAPYSYVVFSPDSSTMASGIEGKTIRLWDVSTGEHKATLDGHTDDVNWIAFSPDGSTLASGSDDKTIRLWDAETSKHKATYSVGVPCNTVVFSPDGNTLASSGAGTILLWKLISE